MGMIRSSSYEDEETKVASIDGSKRSCTDVDVNVDVDADIDLRQNYQNAVECLIQCESIISALQDQLVGKDEQIVGLEERIVQMSLEMASLKAFEDEHRGKRRVSSPDIDDDDESIVISMGDDDDAYKNSPTTIARRYAPARQQHRRGSSWGKGTPTTDNPASDYSLKTSSFTSASSIGSNNCVDDSITGRLSIHIGQLFRKSCSKKDYDYDHDCDNDNAELQKGVKKQMANNNDDESAQQRRRRPPNRRRNQFLSTQLQSSSRSFLEASGVVFPTSFEEVLTKGCLELRNSMQSISLSNEQKKQITSG